MDARGSELRILLAKVPSTKRADVTEILDIARMETSLLKGSRATSVSG